MRKILAAVFVATLFPISSFALTQDEIKAQIATLLVQITALQKQIATQGGAVTVPAITPSGTVLPICTIPRIAYTSNSKGVAVTVIQDFLRSQGTFSQASTGFFGPVTRAALVQFQIKTGIISDAVNDGGIFATRTWAYVVPHFCPSGGTVVVPAVAQCVTSPQPTLSCQGTWQRITNQAGCSTGWTCVQPASTQSTNRPPLISAIVGPTDLKPDVSGTWNVSATDPDGDSLVFSAVYGDEGANLAQLLNIAQQGTPFASATSFTHKYTKTGSYTIVIFAKDAAGVYAKATLTLQVIAPFEINPALSADGSCTLNGVKTADQKTIANPACATSPLCGYPFLQCMKGQWIAVPAGGAGSDDSSISGACILDGVGYAVDGDPECSNSATNAYVYRTRDALPDGQKCENPGALKCTVNGWVGDAVYNHTGTRVACMSKNSLFVPAGKAARGNTCDENGNDYPNREKYYVCRRDGWWLSDPYGNWTQKQSSAPWIADYWDTPTINITY